ncbi:MAG: DUF1573 domain-containing protein [Bacteroidales bacterium]|jgi:hypothetical protein|nr:DUF1573 domain-containing protein [Bacteroidales bacterium]
MISNKLILKVLLVLTIVVFSCSGNSSNKKLSTDVVNNPSSADNINSDSGPVITFEKTEHDFGDIMQGEKVEFAFKFTNTGNKDLVITSHSSSCGCTVPEYPKGVISPNKSDLIRVAFDSKGREGRINKSVTISTNASQRSTVLTIKANIIKP